MSVVKVKSAVTRERGSQVSGKLPRLRDLFLAGRQRQSFGDKGESTVLAHQDGKAFFRQNAGIANAAES